MTNRTPAPCGTYAAYQRHWKRGEDACRPCKDAAAAYVRSRPSYQLARGQRAANPKRTTKQCALPGCEENFTAKGRQKCCATAHTNALWRINNPGRERSRSNNKNGSTSRWRKLRAELLAGHPYCCVCGEPANTVDHIIPLSLGGERYEFTNLRPMCRHHNYSRGNETRGTKWQPSAAAAPGAGFERAS